MKQIATLFTLFLCTMSISFSQFPELEVGELSSHNLGSSFLNLMGSAKSSTGNYQFTTIKADLMTKPALTLLVYDSKLTKTSEKTVDVNDLLSEKSQNDVQACFYWNDSSYLLVADKTRKDRSRDLYVCTANLNETKLSKPRKIATVKGVNMEATSGNSVLPSEFSYQAILSPDSSKVLVYYYDNEFGEINPTMFMQVWVAGFNTLLWEKKINIPFDTEKSIFNSSHLDNSGNVYLLFNVTKDKTIHHAKFNVLRVSQFGTEMTENTIDLGEHTSVELHAYFDKNDDIILFTYHYIGSSLLGMYSVRYPLAMKEIPEMDYYRFKAPEANPEYDRLTAEVDKILGGKESKPLIMLKGEHEQPYQGFKLLYAIPADDGDFILLGERQYTTLESYSTSSGTSSSTYYHFDEIIFIRIDKKGKVLIEKTIYKGRSSDIKYSLYSSYNFVKRGDEIDIFYNKDFIPPTNFSKLSRLRLSMVTIDKKGEIVRKNFEQDDIYPMPIVLRTVNSNEAILGIAKTKGFTIGRLTWK